MAPRTTSASYLFKHNGPFLLPYSTEQKANHFLCAHTFSACNTGKKILGFSWVHPLSNPGLYANHRKHRSQWVRKVSGHTYAVE
jgi:hypothetical protein